MENLSGHDRRISYQRKPFIPGSLKIGGGAALLLSADLANAIPTRLLNSKTTLIILGHAVSEEPGMEWLVDWVKPMLPGVKITPVAPGDPLQWI